MQAHNRILDEVAGFALKALGRLDKLGVSFEKLKEICDMPQKIKALEQEVARLSEQVETKTDIPENDT